MRHLWMYICGWDLDIEEAQARDEGREPTKEWLKELNDLKKRDLTQDKYQARAERLLDAVPKLPRKKGYPYREPSDLEGIQKSRPTQPELRTKRLTKPQLEDRFLGAWLGRCAGCLLGKPVEGARSWNIKGYLTEMGHFPLSQYFSARAPKETLEKYKIDPNRPFIENVDHMVEDDDTNYTATGLAIMKNHGANFTPADVANFWMFNLPILHTCTAERAAYRNFVNGIFPPFSASHRNVYREWIGAQIRADFFGYAALGNPQLAADFAWRDACISHVRNGIYGEMWVAAMLAAAPFCKTAEEVILQGLAQVPEKSRLAERVKAVIAWSREGLSYDEALSFFYQEWNEESGHHWCHTISNAMLVAIGLLYGELDFGLSICRAVQPGFDTDCNGATVGSIVGMMLGAKQLPGKWIGPLNNRLETGVHGYFNVEISQMASETLAIHKSVCP